MGLCITSNYKDAPVLCGGYGMLLRLREVIALKFDEEFGKHYATLRFQHNKEDFEKFDKTANKILEHERFNGEDDILDFLFAPDVRGKVSHKTCKKIYELLKDYKSNICLRYTFHSNNDWEDIKTLLLGCYSHKANLTWR